MSWEWDYIVRCEGACWIAGYNVVLHGTARGDSWSEAVKPVSEEMDRWALGRVMLGDLGQPPKYFELKLHVGCGGGSSTQAYWLLASKYKEAMREQVATRRPCVHGWKLWVMPGDGSVLVRMVDTTQGECYWDCYEVKREIHNILFRGWPQ